MNLFRRLAQIFTGGAPVEVSRVAARNGRFGLRMYAPGSEIDYTKYLGRLRDNAIVAALHAHIARSAAQARIVVLDEDGKVDKAHPINALLRTPSPDHSWNDLQSAWLMDMMTGGNGYANMVPSKVSGVPGQLQYLPVLHTSPISLDPAGVDLITHYEYRSPSGRKWKIDAPQVLHIRMGIDPEDQARGISPLAAFGRELASDNLAARYTAALLLNFGSASIAMTPEGEAFSINPGEWEDAVDAVTRQMTGDSVGGIIAPNFPAKITTIGTTPDDMGIETIWNMAVSRICAAFGADPMALGMASSNKTYANLAEALDATWRNCSQPMLMMIVAAMERTILHGAYGDYHLRLGLDTSGVAALIDDQAEKTKVTATAYQSGIITRAEARREIGFDSTPADEVYYHDAIMGEPKPSDVAAVKKAAQLAKERRARMEVGTEEPDPEE